LNNEAFQTLNKDVFVKKLDEYVVLYLSEFIPKVEQLEKSTEFIFSDKINFLFLTDLGRDFIKTTFIVFQHAWDNHMILFYLSF